MQWESNEKYPVKGRTLDSREISVVFKIHADREGDLKKQIYPFPISYILGGETVILEEDPELADEAVRELVGASEILRMEGEVAEAAYVDIVSSEIDQAQDRDY